MVAMFNWLKSGTLNTGLAIFSMFFGAGNIVFPLALGLYSKEHYAFAIGGLLISAVAVPFLGVATMTLYRGEYMTFLGRIGRWPGFILMIFLMLLIGPFGATPRCVTLAYSTLELFIPGLNFTLYSLVACLVIFVLTYSQKRLLDILGYILTPVLLGSLAVIVIKGIMDGPALPTPDHTAIESFTRGLKEGYNTMDLLGAIFFSSVVFVCLEQELGLSHVADHKRLMLMTFKAGMIGCALLGLVYIGFCTVAALYADELEGTPPEVLLAVLAMKFLGNEAGIVACTAVVLACWTTAIALAAVFAQFLENDIFRGKVNYHFCLAITMIITFFVSDLRFGGIMDKLTPILVIIYPVLIVLTMLNLLYKLTGFKPVKSLVAIALVLSAGAYFIL